MPNKLADWSDTDGVPRTGCRGIAATPKESSRRASSNVSNVKLCRSARRAFPPRPGGNSRRCTSEADADAKAAATPSPTADNADADAKGSTFVAAVEAVEAEGAGASAA